MSLFNRTLIYLSDHFKKFSVTRGIVYGHRMILDEDRNFRIIELDDYRLSFETHDKSMHCENMHDLDVLVRMYGK